MNRTSKISLFSGVLGSIGTLAAWYQGFRRPLPKTNGTERVYGLDTSLTISRDRFGVPTIEAASVRDLCFGQGFCYAQDRLWQLEFFRRVATGRVAEFAGKEGLLPDRLMRRLGLARVAEQEVDEIPSEILEWLQSFCAGIDTGIDSLSALPLELQLLGIDPQPWKPADCLAVGKIVSLAFSTNMESELLRSELAEEIGIEKTVRLEPQYPQGNPIASTGEAWSGDALSLAEQIAEIREAIGISANTIGSNNWVVSGERSVTGKPLLAGDPHVGCSAPDIWYMIRLKAPGFFLQGAGLPHWPGVMIGQSNHVAFSFTNSMGDCQDLFVERLRRGTNCGRLKYEFKGEWKLVDVREETIEVRGAEPETIEIHETHHGPIIGESLGARSGDAISLAWTTLKAHTATKMTIEAGRTKNGAELIEGFVDYKGPCMNMGWADSSGNIGYQMVGSLPMREGNCPDYPKPGWTGEYEWTGLIPFDEYPSVTNPKSGIVVTANNRLVPEDYPHHITSEYLDGFRAARIQQLLEAKEKHSLDDFERMQGDLYSIPGQETAGRILAIEASDERERLAQEILESWDFELAADSTGAAVYQVFTTRFAELVSEAIVGDKLHAARWRSKSMLGFASVISAPWRFQSRLLELWEESDTELTGGRPWEELAREALRETVDELRSKLGDDHSKWTWGRVHEVWFPHLLAEGEGIPPAAIDKLLSRRREIGGGQETICSVGFTPFDGNYDGRWGPTLRLLADPTDPDLSRWQHAPGQSAHVGSKHYDDTLDAWVAGQTNSFDEPAVDVLQLKPL